MERVFPVTEQSCAAHCGKPVLIYLQDGSEIYGVLSRIENGHLILNDTEATVAGSVSKKRKPAASKGKKQSEKAEIQAFGPGPFGYGFGLGFGGWAYGASLAISLASIALLFAFLI